MQRPMVFGLSSAQNETEVTRSAPLEGTHQNFKVGVWKAFDTAEQQNVMDGYEVDYSSTQYTDYGDGYNWHYADINGQLLRYWDLSAFPYEFRAVSPYDVTSTIGDNTLSITADFKSHVLVNDNYYHSYTSETINTPCTMTSGEPCVVANVSREKTEGGYTDTDKIKTQEINTVGKANATREVHMPFHHLMSKVGFQIYIDNPQPSSMDHKDDYEVWIKEISITAKSDEGFVTAATSYTARNGDVSLGRGTFGGLTRATGEHTIFSHNAYQGSGQNLHNHLNRETAFDMTYRYVEDTETRTLDHLHQIPQTGVMLHVRLHIQTNHVETEEQDFYYDSWLSLDTENTTGDRFTWLPDYRYIYILHIPNLHGHEIYLNTCEILPWDEVQTTDIDVGL